MKKLNRGIITFIAAAMFLVPFGAAYAASVAGGELIYKGGQTDSYVYSDIRDAKPSNSKYYNVWAAVKVCSSTYSSGWKQDKAYKQADRKWYCNETSHYDYYQR
ncbi:hypothetical protein ACSVDE_01150 [Pseudalkalibacillus sp. Hm43]|uniref:hypothetical protein n=1 Tax=Pseudalkalibacillus sp. Hm43 TaxID=3450742 RepID=UPI003F42E7FF